MYKQENFGFLKNILLPENTKSGSESGNGFKTKIKCNKFQLFKIS